MATLSRGNLEALRERLRRISAGTIRVVDVHVEPRIDRDGEDYLHVTLVVTEPPPGRHTWSLEDAFQLRQAVRQSAADLDVNSAVFISMTTTGDAGTEEDDREDDDDPTDAAGDEE